MSYTYPKFGCAGNVELDVHGYASDQLEFTNGFQTDLFSLKHTNTVRRDRPSSCAHTYGIGYSEDGTKNSLGRPLDTVIMVEAEECTTPHMIATEPDFSPSLGDKLTYTDGLIFFRKKITITINGRGDFPVGLMPEDRGKTYEDEILIKPAVGSEPVIKESGLYIARVEVTKSVTDWNKFVIELTKYEGNTEDKAMQNMIIPGLLVKTELDAISIWYKLTRTTTLNGKDKANIEESAEIYDNILAAK